MNVLLFFTIYGAYSFDARIKDVTEIYWLRQYLIDPKKNFDMLDLTPTNAHNANIFLTPTIKVKVLFIFLF